MLMIYGLFVFSVKSAPFDKKQRTSNYRWAKNDVVGAAPRYQFLGAGEDSITLSGVLMPEFSGGTLSLTLLRMMADSGDAYLLMSGTGSIYGYYHIESIDETGSFFLANGAPQKIEFTVIFKRYDKLSGRLGQLAPLLPLINAVF